MSARATRLAFWLWVFVHAAACSKDPQKLTQIVLDVDSDLRVPEELDGLSIAVDGVVQMPRLDVALSAQSSLPRTLGLVHAGGPLGPVRVSVRGRLKSADVVERSAEVTFKSAQTLRLSLPLTRVCAEATLSCASDETCDDGACVPRRIASLPVFDGALGAQAGSGASAAGAGAGGDAAANGGGTTAGGSGVGGMDSGGAGSSAGSAAEGGGGQPNQPPACSIDTPADGATYYKGDTVNFSGACNDPESGTIFLVRWRSSKDGSLGVVRTFSASDLSVGAHTISLCAQDPQDSSVTGCATDIELTIEELPAVTASINSITQGNASSGPFTTEACLVSGAGTGVDPLTFTMIDSLLGQVGTTAVVTLQAPVPAGKHSVVLRVSDDRSRSAVSAPVAFTVKPAGASSLFETFDLVNQVVMATGSLTALAASGTRVHVGVSPGVAFVFDASGTPSSASPSSELTTAPALLRDISFWPVASPTHAYVSTSTGLSDCSLSGGSLNTCTTFTSPPAQLSSDIKATLRVTAVSTDSLIVGSAAGLLLADPSNPSSMPKTKADVLSARLAATTSTAWLATAAGLQSLDLTKTIGASPRNNYASPITGLTALALGSNQVWVGGSTGIARYDVASSSWTSWNTGTTSNVSIGNLVSNDVRALAVTRPTVGGVQRDVIWIATSGGLGRYDTSVRSFTTYTTDDGLPSNSVRALVVLGSGELVVGTDAGLVIYRGV